MRASLDKRAHNTHFPSLHGSRVTVMGRLSVDTRTALQAALGTIHGQTLLIEEVENSPKNVSRANTCLDSPVMLY